MYCLLELLTKADNLDGLDGTYEFSIVDDLCIIEVTRKDGFPIESVDYMWLAGVRNTYQVLSGEEWKADWRNDKYHYGIYCCENNSDKLKTIREGMVKFMEDWNAFVSKERERMMELGFEN